MPSVAIKLDREASNRAMKANLSAKERVPERAFQELAPFADGSTLRKFGPLLT
jgi:hypothetical protein